MEVSVVILNWNGESLLRRFLPQVISNTPTDAEIVVADNGSSDGSLSLLRSQFPHVRVIAFDKNYGFAEGYNRAMREVSTPYALMLNSDAFPAKGCVATLLEFMKANPQCAACQPKLLSVNDPTMFEYAGASGGFIDHNGYPYCRGRIFATVERDRGQYDDVAEIDWASGACLMVDRQRYLDVGGLDPEFFAHMEEIDLCWRLRLAGYSVNVVPQASAFHLGGASLSAESPRKTYLNFRNNLLLLHKNLPGAAAKRVLLRRRLLDTIAWGKFILTLKFKNAWAILRAHNDFRRMRKGYPALADDTPDLIASRPNILTAYYLHRRRTFAQLPNIHESH